MVDARACNGTHNIEELAFFTTGISFLLFLSTFSINAFLIFLLSKKLNTSMFYKLILNIALADLLTAIISDISSITFHAQEGLGLAIPLWENRIKHWALFILNGTSVLTMSVLSFNRVLAIMYPFKYRRGIESWKSILIILSTWFVSACGSIPYYYIGYIRYLGIFASINIVLTMICLIGAVIIYSIYLKPSNRILTQMSKRQFTIAEKDATGTVRNRADTLNNGKASLQLPTVELTGIQLTKKPSKDTAKPSVKSLERSANKSFLLMLVVFLITYIPAIAMTIYMNACWHCDCVIVHCLRDFTYLAILSSALWRPLNFMLRLKNIRRQARAMLCCKST